MLCCSLVVFTMLSLLSLLSLLFLCSGSLAGNRLLSPAFPVLLWRKAQLHIFSSTTRGIFWARENTAVVFWSPVRFSCVPPPGAGLSAVEAVTQDRSPIGWPGCAIGFPVLSALSAGLCRGKFL